MKKISLLLTFFVLFSCSENDLQPWDPGTAEEQNIVTDRSGKEYPGLDPSVIYCGPAWGRKFCRFTAKYNGTTWTNSNSSSIEFSNFTDAGYFITFFNLNDIASNGETWKIGETTSGGIKWDIRIKKDQDDSFWFEYKYFGSGEEVEYMITYKCEVVDDVLTFRGAEGQIFNFNPS